MGKVIHFDVHADDPQRAMVFYSSLLGWQFNEYMPGEYWLITCGPADAPGIDGGLIRRRPGQSGDIIKAFVCSVEVVSVDDCRSRLEGLGGTVAMDKHAIPGVGWQFYAKDTEGNIFGLHQSDPSAA